MNHRERGFTAIEMIVTVVVAALLIIAINALYSAVVRTSSVQRNRAEASDLAYANLRHFAYTGATARNWFVCNGSTNGNGTSGQQLLTASQQSISASQTVIPQPVSASVIAFAPYGCTLSNAGSPILVRSTVTYGPSNDTVTHTEYVGF